MTTEEDDDTTSSNDFSNESQTTDYTSIEGLRTRLGIDNDRLFGNFIVKELMDNALDFIEQNAKKIQELKQKNKDENPYVNVTITEEEIENKKKITKIIVRNSNTDNDVFPKNGIENIFNLEKYYSSKRHQHIIKRGALGDGLKEILCIPYAFAIENNDDSWNYPLIFNISNKKLIEVRINNLSQVRKNLESPDITITSKELSIEEEETNNKFTEIVVYLPNIAVYYNSILFLFNKYALSNTHIDFHFELPNKHYYKPNYKATQNIVDWSNYQSIYYYSLPDFERLIYSLQDKSNSNIANYVQKYFREGTNIKKDELLDILNSNKNSIIDKNNKNIEGIYQRLKQIPSKGPQLDNKRQVPFDQKKRENALKKRFGEIYQINDDDSFVYKKINGYFSGSNHNSEIEFPYILEIIIANIPYYPKKLYFYSSINFSPTLRYNPFQNQSNEDIFSWKNKKKRKDDSQTKPGSSIIDILEDCGYSYDTQKHNKSKPNLVMINLISPRVDYTGRNKSYIKLDQFVSSAQEIYDFCKSASTRNKNGIRDEGLTVINELRILARERELDIRNNPRLREIGRWTQSTFFYTVRPRLNQKGLKVDRDYITSQIKPVCEELGYTRDELGIIAAERAQLYFKGQTLGVGFDQLKDLMEKGTDLLVIEKEGIADVLAPFAEKVGIAILNSRGFLTEYATKLSRLAKEKGCNIAILTDLDSSGLIISTKLPNAHRIGIDFDTLFSLERLYDDLELYREDVEEDVILKKGNESDNHLISLKKYDYTIPSPYNNFSLFDNTWEEMIDYLDKGKRIEIDAVLAKVGSERFWNFILNELDKKFPNRNYNRAITISEYVLPKTVDNFIANIQNKISELQSEERQKIMDKLENTKGFLDVNHKKAEIESNLRSIAEEKINEVTQFISDEFKKFSNLK